LDSVGKLPDHLKPSQPSQPSQVRDTQRLDVAISTQAKSKLSCKSPDDGQPYSQRHMESLTGCCFLGLPCSRFRFFLHVSTNLRSLIEPATSQTPTRTSHRSRFSVLETQSVEQWLYQKLSIMLPQVVNTCDSEKY
jgi:hypothetical protein